MENASKALIIAGSILVSIVIISLGVMIVSNVTGLVQSQSDMSAQEVQTFNAPFIAYEGTQKGSNARTLYNLVRSHNNTHTDDKSLQISLTIDGGDFNPGDTQAANDGDKDAEMDTNTLKAGNTYNVTYATDPNSGRITAINIQTKK